MKFKKVPILLSVVLSLISVALFIGIAMSYLNPGNYELMFFAILEKEIYAFAGFCYLYIFHYIALNAKRETMKIVLSFLCSFVCTVQVFLLNNLWHYIEWNEMFDWENPFRYSGFLIDDLGYRSPELIVRYPLVFGLMFIACLADTVFVPIIKSKFEEHLPS